MEFKIRGIPAEKILEMHKLKDSRVVLKVRNRKGEGDFRVAVYDPGRRRVFTPKHAHFAIDIYGKLCRDENITRCLFELIEKIYEGSNPSEVLKGLSPELLLQFDKLPGYDIEYILYCLAFIFEQEDVNFKRFLKERGGRLPDIRKNFLAKQVASRQEITQGRFLAWRLFKRVVKDKIHLVDAMQEVRLRI